MPRFPSSLDAALFRFRTISAVALLSLLSVAALSCDNAALLAPTGATIIASVAPSTIAVGGDTASLSLLLRQADGSHVDDGTQVEVVATNAQLCRLADSVITASRCGEWRGIVTLSTTDGVANAAIRSTDSPGAITLEFRSGTSTASATLSASGRVVPDKGKLLVQAEHDSVVVGAPDRIIIFATDSSGTSVADGTRIVITTAGNQLSRQIAVTVGGFVETSFTGVTPGDALVTVASGNVKATKTITVRQ